jgi:hypothetical protein
VMISPIRLSSRAQQEGQVKNRRPSCHGLVMLLVRIDYDRIVLEVEALVAP